MPRNAAVGNALLSEGKAMKSIEFKAEVNGQDVDVHAEVDGYKPLGVEATDANGNEIELTTYDEDRLYEIACEKVQDGLIAAGDAELDRRQGK